jgi:hypothetical protein
MPIRPDLGHFYRGPVWRAIRRRIVERAGGKFSANGNYLGGAQCEQCRAPDRLRIERGPFGTWCDWPVWCDCHGETLRGPIRFRKAQRRSLIIVLTVAHLDHDPEHGQDANLKALCQWCHLNWDRLHHAETRKTRKDQARPLLVEA